MPHTDVIPTSASIASTGLGVRYIGKWAYAYSGQFSEVTTPQLVLDFTTGSGIIVAELQFNSFVGETDPNLGSRGTCAIVINGEALGIIKAASSSDATPSSVTQKLILPPLTHLTATIDASSTGVTSKGSVIFTGRVYGAE